MTCWYCGNEQMQLWVKFGHWVGMTVTQWRKAQQMWSVQFFYISKTNLENHIKIHHGENPTSVASAILQHLKQQILKIIWRYKVEENPTSVASAILQHLKQQILTIIWRCIVEENPTSVASVNLQSLKQPSWELITGYTVGKSPTNVIIVTIQALRQTPFANILSWQNQNSLGNVIMNKDVLLSWQRPHAKSLYCLNKGNICNAVPWYVQSVHFKGEGFELYEGWNLWTSLWVGRSLICI